MDGFLIVNKDKGMTSFSLCNKIRKKFNLDKTGHTGTLDPNATGVMVIACNRACKLLKLFQDHKKAYIATIVFGIDTDTLDLDTTNIISNYSMDVDINDILINVEKLSKLKTQLPPLTSSIKVNGKKLYEYQRENKEVEVKERDVHINSYKILSDLRYIDNHYEIDIYLDVSKGYYIRAFCRDLGKLLNGCAVLKELKRVSVDDYIIDNSKTLDALELSDIIPITSFLEFDYLEVNDYIAHLVKNGVTLDERQIKTDKPFYIKNNNKIIALYEVVDTYKYKPLLLFNENF